MLHIRSIFRNSNTDFILGNCLFGSIKVTTNADQDKYKYSGCGKGFDSCSKCSLTDGSMEKNVAIFGSDVSSSVYDGNEGKCILILSEGPTQHKD